jgi:dipeptidyl-peptidase-4
MVAKRVDSAQSMHLTNNGMRTKMMLGAFSALFLMVGNVCGQVATKFVKIDDVIKYSFYPQRVWGLNPMHDGKLYSSFTQTGDIAVSSYQTGAVVKTIPLGKVEDVSDYAFDASDSKLLISTKVNQIYRHSFTAQYVVLDVASGEAKALSDSGAQQQAT